MKLPYFYLAICFVLCWCSTFSITDEEYALMPNVFETENFDSCMLLRDKAFYCAISYQLTPLDPHNPPKVWKTIAEYSASDMHYRHDILRRFICVPKTCPNVKTYNKTDPKLRKELTECFDKQYRDQGFKGTVGVLNCKKNGPLYKLDDVDIYVAVAFFTYIGWVLLCSAYDVYKSYDAVDKYNSFKYDWGRSIVAFSIMSNWNKLKKVPTGAEFERLKPVQGLRVYMSMMVIAVHVVLAQVAVPIKNTKLCEDVNDSPDLLSNIPKRAVFMLSFHFMMSSWILMSSLLSKQDKNENLDIKFIIKSIVKRYLRFILTIAVVVGFLATWFRHIPYGPFFDAACEETQRCRKNWWTNLLFIQNHYDRYYMCHIITWYLAVDMQYYIIGLFLLWVVFKKKINIPVVSVVLLVINFVFAYLDHQRHGYPSTLSGKPEEIYRLLFNRQSQWHDHFANYHANAAGYIAGIGFGYIYYKSKNVQIFKSMFSKVLWAVLSSTLVSLTIVLPQIIDVDATTTTSALWVALTRPLFSIGMGIFVLGLSEGLGGWAGDVLNWSPLYVLGKLSYCVYLCHTIFQILRTALMRSPGYLSYYTMVENISSDILMSLVAALFLSLIFEMPSNEMANIMLEPKRKPQIPEKKTK